MRWPWGKKDQTKIKITREEVFVLLKPYGITSIELSDKYWYLLPDDKYKEIAYASGVKDRIYKVNLYDCENFTHSLIEAFNTGDGWIFGGCRGRTKSEGAHAWCFYINENKKVRFVEPQTYRRVGDIISIMSFYTI